MITVNREFDDDLQYSEWLQHEIDRIGCEIVLRKFDDWLRSQIKHTDDWPDAETIREKLYVFCNDEGVQL